MTKIQDLAALWTHGEAGAREHLRNMIETGEPFRARDRLALAYLLTRPAKARLDADKTAKPLTEIVAVMPESAMGDKTVYTVHLGQATHYVARPALCRAQSPGNFDGDEADYPVTCSRPKGHEGKHAGGSRCGSLEWQ
jgi:hypothetical protein